LSYRVRIVRSAERAITKLPTAVQGSILERLDELAADPHPEDARKVRALPPRFKVYRVTVAKDYRIVYQVKSSALEVLVVRVGDRKDVYKRIGDIRRLLQ